MVTTKLITAEELELMGGDAPYELIRGELHEVCPSSFGSSTIAMGIGATLLAYVKPRRLGFVSASEAGFTLLRNPDTVVAPDAAFVRRDRIPPSYDFRSFFPGVPDLAVEVVSPSDRERDIASKIELYLSFGTPLVWLVRPDEETVEIHRRGRAPRLLRSGDELDGEDIVPGFRMPVAEIFNLFA